VGLDTGPRAFLRCTVKVVDMPREPKDKARVVGKDLGKAPGRQVSALNVHST
jgi:hypothetical protein